ncbi:putative lipid II flippase FtsW [Clostridium gasigenes]|uniref:Probable peptidoglycan glycosyltransferase FtsW n=1 Tax=Clostridium gasigenes TaxID=94869 RepID=A0A7X0SDM6_9CLOT|nr:putative lipid II flippase FtsW [Clostridium gasigenes]MBB6715716.1 putative lipid II flippase FtsW [Clostridium gasigenes]MBU3106814.1 putative lipid II flippase FtsW [Clostridium gasigenes]
MKLNSIKKKAGKIDFQIFCTIILIVCIGIVMVYSSSAYYSLHVKDESTEFFLKKELIWTIVGIIVMIFTMSVDYHLYKKMTLLATIGTIGCLVAVLFSNPINGATRWIFIGGFSFQPSELAKYVVVMFMAMSIDNRKKKMDGFLSGTILYLFIAAAFSVLILLENNLSIASIIMIVTFIMILVGGANIKHLVCLIPPVAILGMVLIFSADYRKLRFLGFLDPWADSSGRSFQLIQSFYALGSGGITGVGLGQSTQKALYMPEPYNDFIFAIIGEELGLIGCILVMGLFLFLILRGISVAIRAKDNYGFMLATGIISIIAVQAMINIAVVTGSMPVTGVPLPFISYGGTSMVFNLAAMGVLLNISRQAKEIKI